MDTTLWVKFRPDLRLSWHVVGKGGYTRCGRPFMVDAPSAVDLPLDEKSCESCARLVLHDQEKVAK